MRITITPRIFRFKRPAGTSRGIYTTRHSWLVEMTDERFPGRKGIGECAPLPGLSIDACECYGDILKDMCLFTRAQQAVNKEMLRSYPSILFGLETAWLNLERGSNALFDTPFSRGEEGIPINGLVWMGTFEEMSARIEEKLSQGFTCVKLKIGAIDFEQEMDLIRQVRSRYGKHDVELRVDANGGFTPENAMSRLERLAKYDIHSIEQPIRQRQWQEMARLCRESPLPIALDEELIGMDVPEVKEMLLDTIHPAYIVLKPSLHGGMNGTREWVSMARKRGIGSWITSALESNVGLNAVAQLAADIYGPHITMPQGLGTGLLFTNNVKMPIRIKGDKIWFTGKK